jgi:hypothetical protein
VLGALFVAGFFFLAIALLCAVTARILLASAAFGISIWWGFGVFLPFGPMIFRLTHPDLAYSSRMFRLATLPCLFLYFILGPGVTPFDLHHKAPHAQGPGAPTGYAMESSHHHANAGTNSSPSKAGKMDLQARAVASDREFERLRVWSEKLRLEKRDLLHSDVVGNRAYALELGRYNAAVKKANAEKMALLTAPR